MPQRRRRAAPKKRRRRAWPRVVFGLLLVVVVFCAAAGATLWLAESSRIFSTDLPAQPGSERFSPEERRALEDILKQRAPQQP